MDCFATANQRRFATNPQTKLTKLAKVDKAHKLRTPTKKPSADEGVKLGLMPGAGVYKRVP